jgi:hypothetical protein
MEPSKAGMNWDRLNGWLNLLANMGVLVGLILLVVEVRHAISLSELEVYRDRGTEIQEAMQELALSTDLAEIIVKATDGGVIALSPKERVRLSAWYMAMLYRMQNQFNDYQLGYLDDVSYQAMLRAAARILPLSRQLGVEIARDFDPEFIASVERRPAE